MHPHHPFWVGTGWKMNKTLAEAEAYADALRQAFAAAPPTVNVFVVPPFTVLRQVKQRLAGAPVLVGAQNMHWDDTGAWTGEISAPMLTDCGADLVELGHSERRTHFNETDAAVGGKVAAARRHGLIALVCIGETRDEREAGAADEVLARQTRAALAHVPGANPAEVVFAYEPVWAIGSGGEPATPDYAEARHRAIKAAAAETMAATPQVLYGGSVNADNCAGFAAQPSIDGLFIGRAAWDVAGLIDIIGRATAARAAA